MANTKKLTKKDNFNALLSIEAVKSNPVLVDFINHEIELLNRKNTSEKKPTATQKENEVFKAEILEVLDGSEPLTISEITKASAVLADLSNQRISAIVRLLRLDGKVERTEVKGKAYFSKI